MLVPSLAVIGATAEPPLLTKVMVYWAMGSLEDEELEDEELEDEELEDEELEDEELEDEELEDEELEDEESEEVPAEELPGSPPHPEISKAMPNAKMETAFFIL